LEKYWYLDDIYIDQLTISNETPLSGIFYVPTDYATLELFIDDLNLKGVGPGGLTVVVEENNAQVAPPGGYLITGSGAIDRPVNFIGNGNTITAALNNTAGALNDGIITLIGADYITIDDFVLQENPANNITDWATNNMTEFGIAQFTLYPEDGSKNLTITNCNIDLNKAYANTFGFYSTVRHTRDDVLTENIASEGGSHDTLVIQGCNITDVNQGIILDHEGRDANYIQIGGRNQVPNQKDYQPELGNAITNFGSFATMAQYGEETYSGSYGIRITDTRPTTDAHIESNTITSALGATTDGDIWGIYLNNGRGSNSTNQITIDYNQIELYSGNSSGDITGIYTNIGAWNTYDKEGIISLSNNTFNGMRHELIGRAEGDISFLRAAKLDVAYAKVHDNSFNTIRLNTIGETSLIYLYSAEAKDSITVMNNNLTGGLINTAERENSDDCAVLFINFGGARDYVRVANNTVEQVETDGKFVGIIKGYYAYWPTSEIHDNLISDISCHSGFNDPSYGINARRCDLHDNVVKNITCSGAFRGIYVYNNKSDYNSKVYNNQVYNLSHNDIFSGDQMNGLKIDCEAGIISAFNNFIFDIQSSAEGSMPVAGIYIEGSSSGEADVSYNTVFLNVDRSETSFDDFGSAALYSISDADLLLRNNVLVNTSDRYSSVTAALWFQNQSLTEYMTSSNGNDLHVGNGTGKHVFRYGSTNITSIENFKATMQTSNGGSDSRSFDEFPPFISDTEPYDLHIKEDVETALEKGGIRIENPLPINVDADGDTRGYYPDVGADEFDGLYIPLDDPIFIARGRNSHDIILEFTLNTQNEPIVIVFNETGIFTEIDTVPVVGENFAGGKVLTISDNDTEAFTHIGIIGTDTIIHPDSTIYYKAFSTVLDRYSYGVESSASPQIYEPENLTANAVSAQRIDVTTTANEFNDNVIVAYGLDPDFGAPIDGEILNVGDDLPGEQEDVVIYNGPAGTFEHKGLDNSTQYYYKAWTVDNYNYYSTDFQIANALTENYGLTSFDAVTFDSRTITINWDFLTVGYDIVLAASTSNDIGEPIDGTSIALGDPIPGGSGQVIYRGQNTSFDHENLTYDQRYFYKAWVVDGDDYYSIGYIDNARPVVNPPLSITAVPSGPASINLDWIKNTSNHSVIVAFNTINDFGTPVNANPLNVGSTVPGSDAIIIYKGPLQTFLHDDLFNPAPYYYKIWSVDQHTYYSNEGLLTDVSGFAPQTSIKVAHDWHNQLQPQQLLEDVLASECLNFSNVRFGYYSNTDGSWVDHTWFSDAGKRQLGYYSAFKSDFPFREGVLLSSGDIKSAEGPNDNTQQSDYKIEDAGDPDLAIISGHQTHDAAVFEYEFEAPDNYVFFRYMFGSEEYLEYVETGFNDAFGFFLSGPGIDGGGLYTNNAVNMAEFFNGDGVSVNTIHPSGVNIDGDVYSEQNAHLYLNNPPGTLTTQFDGNTKALFAIYPTTPCETYKLKIAVADASDQRRDVAVFFEALSFGGPQNKITHYNNDRPDLDYAHEGCPNTYFLIRRTDSTSATTLGLEYLGTAINGVDFTTLSGDPLPTTITMAPSQGTYRLDYLAVSDPLEDPNEFFVLRYNSFCNCDPSNEFYVSKRVDIYEDIETTAIAQNLDCSGTENGVIVVNSTGGSGNYQYSIDTAQTWNYLTNTFTGLSAGDYMILAKDTASCYVPDTVRVSIGAPEPVAAVISPIDPTICQAESVQLFGSGGVNYAWSPTTGLSDWRIANPIASPETTTTYTLTVTDETGACTSTEQTTVTVNSCGDVTPLSITKNADLTDYNTVGQTVTYTIVLTNNGTNPITDIEVNDPVLDMQVELVSLAPGVSSSFTETYVIKDADMLTDSIINGVTAVGIDIYGRTVSAFDDEVIYNNSLNNGSISVTATALDPGYCGVGDIINFEIVVENTGPVNLDDVTVTDNKTSLNQNLGTLLPGVIQTINRSYTIVQADVDNGSVTNTVFAEGNDQAGDKITDTDNATSTNLPVPAIPDVVVSAPDCGINGSALVSNFDALNAYDFNPTGPNLDASGNISNFAFGQAYTLKAKNTEGCESPVSPAFIIFEMLPTPDAPTIAVTAATCSADGSASITNYDAGYTYTFDPVGPSVDGSGNIISFTLGQAYTVIATNADGCESAVSSSFTIEEMLPTPDAPTIVVTAATCSANGSASITNYDAGYTYTFDPVGPSVDGSGNIISFTLGETYTVTATNADGCTSVASAAFTIEEKLPTPDAPTIAVTAATCSANGSASITNYDAGYTYTFDPLGPSVDVSGNIISFTLGQAYTLTATSADGCTSVASTAFTIEEMLPTPDAPTIVVTAPTCSADGSASITNYDAGYTYTFDPVGPSVDVSGNVISFTLGQAYTVTATNADGCTSASSASFTIEDLLPTPDAPTIAVTAPTCSADGSASITNYDAGYTYTFDPMGPSVDGSGNIISFAFGQAYTVTATNADGCTSVASAAFTIEEMLPTPDAPTIVVTAATCSADGSASISNYDAGYTYTFDPVGPSLDGSGNIISFTLGQAYTLTATNADGCTSVASAAFTIEEKLPTPDAPTIAVTAPTCSADGSASITNYDAGYTYTFDPVGPSLDGSGNIISFAFGQAYTVTATNADGCTSVASAAFTIEEMLPTPDAPTIAITAPTCSADGSASITNYDAGYTYTFVPVGPSVDGSGNIISFTLGQAYTLTATNGDGCISDASGSFIIEEMLPTPAAPVVAVTAPTCSADGSAQLTNYNGTYSYTFDPAGPAVDGSGNIISFTLGQAYTLTATNGDGCISDASGSFIIEEMLPTPAAPVVAVTAPTCSADGSASITNYDAGYTYTFVPVGPSVDGSGNIISFTLGQAYTLTATNGDGCISDASGSFIIEEMLPTPAAPVVAVTAPTCSADGSAQLTNYNGTYSYTFDPAGPAVDGSGNIISFVFGQAYTVTATNADGCTSVASAAFTMEEMLPTPDAPIIVVSAPDCNTDGSALISNYDANYTYTFDPIGPVVDGGGTISSLTFGQLYTVTATSPEACVSASSISFSVEEMLPTPDAPTLTVSPPTCNADGSALISNYDPLYTYTFDPAGPTVDGSGNIQNFTLGLAYTLTATNADGCESAVSSSFTIEEMLPTPDAPTIVVSAPDCNTDGSASISNYDANYTYTFDPIGPVVDGGGTINSLIFGQLYTVTATSPEACVSAPSISFSVEEMLPTPDAPTLTVSPPTCNADGSALVSNYDAGYTYTFDPAGPTLDGSGNIQNFTLGLAYTLTATNADGCESAVSSSFTIEEMLPTPDAPTIVVSAPDCNTDGSASISNYDANYTYTFDPMGPVVDGGGTISSLIFGQLYTVTATSPEACVSAPSISFSVEEMLPIPDAPTVTVSPATCNADGSALVSNYNAGYTYTFDPAGPTLDGSGNIQNFTLGLAYTLTATNADGCESAVSSSFTIEEMLPTPDAPTIVVSAPDCNTDGSASISNYDANYTYTFDPMGPVVDGGGTISSLIFGQLYTVTATSPEACVSAPSISFSVEEMLPIPDAPTVTVSPATCNADGSALVSNYDAGYTYTFDPAGPTLDGSGNIQNFTLGLAYTLTATNADGCESAVSSSFTIEEMLPTPDAPTIVVSAPDCNTDGSASISNYDANYTYTFDPMGPVVDGGGTISSLIFGQLYTVTATSPEACVSAPSISFSVEEMLPIPDAPTVTVSPATCNADGSALVSNYDAGYTYTFDPAGPTLDGTGNIISFAFGQAYTATATNADGCESAFSSSFMIEEMLPTPDAPTIVVSAPDCNTDGSASISNYDANYTYTFDPIGPVVDGGGTINSLIFGQLYTVTATSPEACVSAPSISFSVEEMLPTPDAPTVTVSPATCNADGSALVSNYDAGYTYTFDPAGPTLDGSGNIQNFTLGLAYTLTATNADGCESAVSSSFTIEEMLPTPDAPTIVVSAPDCNTDGSASISNYDANYTYTFDPIGPVVDGGGTISSLTFGQLYTVTATSPEACVSASSISFSVEEMLPTPDAPTITVSPATCNADGSALIGNYNAGYTYTFDPAGPSVDGTGNIISFAFGQAYTVTATNADGCESAVSSSFTIEEMLPTPDAPIIVVSAPDCNTDGSALISNYDANYTYTFDPIGPVVDGGGTISSLTFGQLYTVTATSPEACVSASSISFSVEEMLPTPDAPTVTVTPATCNADGSALIGNYNAGYTYTFDPAGPSVDGTGNIISFAFGQAYTVTATNADGCESAVSISFTIEEMLPTPDAPTIVVSAPDCNTDGSASISNYDANYTYTFDPIGPVVDGGGTISSLTFGQLYTVTATSPEACVSATSISFSVEEMLPTPDAPTVTVTPATCNADGSALIGNYNAGYTYTFDPAGPSVDGTGNIISFAFGQAYTVTATNADGCESAVSSSFTIEEMLPTPDAPTIVVSAPDCNTDGSASISNYDANYTYTFDPIGPVVDGGGTISSLTFGQLYTVTATSPEACVSASSISFSVEEMLPTPDAPTITVSPATCNADGSALISNYNAGYTYTFDPAGPSVDGSGNIISFAFGQAYAVTATNADGCESAVSSSFTIEEMLPTPDAPTIVVSAPDCNTDGSASISNYDANYTYTFDPIGPVVDGGGTISSLTFGQLYTVNATSPEACVSASSISFSVEEMLPTPDAPTITVSPATCNADGSALISNYDPLYTYTFDPAGPTVNGTGNIISFAFGQAYAVTATNADGCESAVSSSFTIEEMLPTPDAPTILVSAPDCNTDGSASISIYDANYTYTFDPIGPVVDGGGTISSLTFGQLYTVTATSPEACVSASSISFSVEEMLPTPDAPTLTVSPATCNADGSALIGNYNAGYTYTFDPAGPSVDGTGNIISFAFGQAYTVTATNADGCESAVSSSFTIEEMLPTPDAPTIVVSAPDCNTDGSASITNYDAGYTYTFDPVGPSVDGSGNIISFAFGQAYTVTATNADGCESAVSSSFMIEEMLPTPDAPTVTVTPATCNVHGSALISNYDPLYTYTFVPAGPSVDGSGNIISFTLGQAYTVTATNADGCESAVSSSFTIEEMLPTPDAPIIVVSAPDCNTDGSALISNYDANYTYTFDPIGPVVDGGGTISSLTFGQLYTVTATSPEACVSASSISFSVEEMLPTPDAPTVTVTPATCNVDGSALISNYDPLYTYTFVPAGPSVDGSGNIISFTLGQAYTVTATNADGCESAVSSSFTIEEMLPTPDAPIIVVSAPDCNTDGSALISNYDANYTYTFDPIGPVVDGGGNIISFAFGQAYTVTATNADGCESAVSSSFMIEEMLPTPDAPTLTVTPATCNVDGSALISNYDPLYTYTFVPAGPSVDGSGNIISFTLGQAYTVTATNADGCESAVSSSFTIEEMLPTPDAPIIVVSAPDCNTDGSALISNYDANYTYTFDPIGPVVDGGGNIISFAFGQAYTVTATNADGCESAISAGFVIEEMLEAPDIPEVVVTAPDCSIDGSAVISNYSLNYSYTFDPTGPIVDVSGQIIDFVYGQAYTVTATSADDCVSPTSPVFVIDEMIPTPDRPEIVVIAAACGIDGSAFVSNFNITNTYTFNPLGPELNGSGQVINFIFGQSYTITTTNIQGCESAVSVSFIIEEMLELPDAPEVMVTLPDCNTAGSALVSNYDANYTYTFDPAGPAVDVNGQVIDFIFGQTYTIIATNADDCVSPNSPLFAIQEMLPTPDPPILSLTQPDCINPIGMIEVTSPLGADLEYSIDGIDYQSSPIFTNLVSGIYMVSVRNSDNCISDATIGVIEEQPPTPDAPELDVILASCGSYNEIVVVSPLGSGLMYSLNGSDYQSSPVFSDLLPGEYSIRVLNDWGCESSTYLKIDSPNNSLQVIKTSSPGSYQTIGQQIDYTILVSNLGEVDLCDLFIDDPLIGLSATESILEVGNSIMYTGSYTTTQEDLWIGRIDNRVDVEGFDPYGTSVRGFDSLTIYFVGPPIAIIANPDYDTTSYPLGTEIDVLFNDLYPEDSDVILSIVDFPSNGTLSVNSDQSIFYSPGLDFYGDDIFIYQICLTEDPAVCDTAAVYIHVLPDDDTKDVVATSGVSPDGNGLNDTWYISNIDLYPDNTVILFNRWGSEVNRFERYNNTDVVWDGTNSRGERVSDGVYYYLIELRRDGSEERILKGWVMVKRTK
jgi:gliding motility-associated-like protein/uncharacterized repeat protein (TIGR01451 family)